MASDHCPIILTLNVKSVPKPPRFTLSRVMGKLDHDRLFADIFMMPKFTVALFSPDPNKATEALQGAVSKALGFHVLMTRHQIVKNNKRYISHDTLRHIKDWDLVAKTAHLTKLNDNICVHRYLCIVVSKAVKQDTIHALQRVYEESANNPSKIWVEADQVLACPPTTAPSKLLHQAKFVTKPAKIAEILNNIYVDKPNKIHATMNNGDDTMPHYRKVKRCLEDKLEFRMITQAETCFLLTHMNPTKLTAQDGIAMMTLRQNMDILSAHITNIISVTITTDAYPQCLKENKVVPVAI